MIQDSLISIYLKFKSDTRRQKPMRRQIRISTYFCQKSRLIAKTADVYVSAATALPGGGSMALFIEAQCFSPDDQGVVFLHPVTEMKVIIFKKHSFHDAKTGDT